MKFLTEDELTARGVPGCPVTRWRKRRDRKLPRQTKFGRFDRSPEPLIDKYLEAMAAGHSEEQATIIAEDFLKALLAQSAA
jgi:GrpB-like predicted nucleotidyltransferase (UPF0157 family)